MNDWKEYLNSDPTQWLLEDDNPSVRYFTLLDILDKPQNDSQVIHARQNIMNNGVVPKILAKQESSGYWGVPENFYVRGKYKGTSWQLIILAELGADGNDERIKRACEFILEKSQDPQSGAFSYISHKKDGHGDPERVLPCLTANMAWSLIRLGYLGDDRIQKALQWLIKYQRFDDEPGKAPDEWPYNRWKQCWGERTCHSIIVKSLKAFAEIPEDKRTPEISDYIVKGVEHMLNHHIHKRNHPPVRGSFKWLEFGFPLMWSIDALEVLEILTRLGYNDERMHESLKAMISKQDHEGRWILENTFNGRFQTNIERKGKPSKWITLNALRVLKRFYP
ncbi:nitrogen fixation protein NifH [Methanobacterium subterraneum]|uniref:Nitrogen fixation protein NifH n=1 Tax=Methanobacterium subterraneum TaxID=59277 RepID=A0A2H4VQU8_9EURY|nr:prenyltransferase/squalene oxidase repeat-containing protein [Methanobacterium subterraneum]AUB60468.1 nitrogen fixation protein NifH [Methanobacterium subterraneum]